MCSAFGYFSRSEKEEEEDKKRILILHGIEFNAVSTFPNFSANETRASCARDKSILLFFSPWDRTWGEREREVANRRTHIHIYNIYRKCNNFFSNGKWINNLFVRKRLHNNDMAIDAKKNRYLWVILSSIREDRMAKDQERRTDAEMTEERLMQWLKQIKNVL